MPIHPDLQLCYLKETLLPVLELNVGAGHKCFADLSSINVIRMNTEWIISEFHFGDLRSVFLSLCCFDFELNILFVRGTPTSPLEYPFEVTVKLNLQTLTSIM